ncbi:CHAT domain-containing protein [Aerosakkonemataceae cyanobacterium BLCC-F50]|uniref:CHAT domain-containing protein n=1 Tax=Floridaenema flaviceps BLCC-F50 TaxID=3153642 RepID=A0ABV4XKW5_9CYAN
MDKLALISFEDGDFERGFTIKLRLGEGGKSPSTEISGRLPPAPKILENYRKWQSAIHILTGGRMQPKPGYLTNVSFPNLSQELIISLNSWLSSELFRSIRETLLLELKKDDEVRLLIQSSDAKVRQLPWQLWELFESYSNAEVGLSLSNYKGITSRKSYQNNIQILAILGDDTGIDTQKDRSELEKLPQAETQFLVKPELREINDQLWDKPWDILFFAGHSRTEVQTGRIYINDKESLTINQLKFALKRAIAQGLQLAIFNSCDGLGLAQDLADLHIPQIIVMREPVPDKVAQEFLKYFLAAFSSGKSFYLAVREARERLQWLEQEFPCASWLPVICQNPAEVLPTWQELTSGKLSTEKNNSNGQAIAADEQNKTAKDYLMSCFQSEMGLKILQNKGSSELEAQIFNTIYECFNNAQIVGLITQFQKRPTEANKSILLSLLETQITLVPLFAKELIDLFKQIDLHNDLPKKEVKESISNISIDNRSGGVYFGKAKVNIEGDVIGGNQTKNEK